MSRRRQIIFDPSPPALRCYSTVIVTVVVCDVVPEVAVTVTV
jgi:hypothetical protein